MKKCSICHRKFKKSKMSKFDSVEMISYICLFTRRTKKIWICSTCEPVGKHTERR